MEEVEEQLKSVFRVFDWNQDGKLDIDEFLSALAVSIHGTPHQKLEVLLLLLLLLILIFIDYFYCRLYSRCMMRIGIMC